MNADDRRTLALEDAAGRDARKGEVWKRPFSLENKLQRLGEMLAEDPDARLVIIDPISANGGKIDSHRNPEVRILLAPLADLAGIGPSTVETVFGQLNDRLRKRHDYRTPREVLGQYFPTACEI